jgi:probable HAF family extracellular repeat protein
VFSGGSGASEARDVNAAGNIVVGIVGTGSFPRAFRWVEGGTAGSAGNPEMQDLGSLRTDNGGLADTQAVNPDGDVVVGIAENDAGSFLAYRWTEGGVDGPASNPEMQSLGTLTSDGSGFSWAFGINDDGAVVVGYGTTDSGDTQAFRWVEDGDAGVAANPQMERLGTLRSDGTGFSRAYDVSADGSVVVGEAETDDGTIRAFIWRTEMQDFENLIGSIPVLTNDTEIAVAQQQAVVGRLMDETCLAEDDQSCLRVGGWLTNIGSTASQDIGRRTSGVATLTYGRGLDGQTTVGGTLSMSGSSLSSNGFDMGTGVGFSLWSEYSEGGLARTGWQAGAAVGWGRESGSITRGRGLENVMLATGDASLETVGARATIGYGFQQQDWLITPSATLAHFRTSRSAYTETGADFNASYDALSLQRTTATLAIAGERSVAEQGILSLGVGVEHDLSADRATLTGTSTIPGMETFAVGSNLERHRTRGFLDAGYTHDLGDNRTISGSLRVGQAAFGSAPQVSLGVHYGVRF